MVDINKVLLVNRSADMNLVLFEADFRQTGVLKCEYGSKEERIHQIAIVIE